MEHIDLCRGRFTPSALPQCQCFIEHGYARRDFSEKRLRHHELSDIGIRHSLFVADIHTRLLLAARSGPTVIADWQEGSGLWDTSPAGDGIPAIPVRPDAYFILKHAERPEERNKVHVFLEPGRSTMAHSRMATKIAGYLGYYEPGRHAKKYPSMQAFLVATATQTRSRARELQKDLHPLIPHSAWRDAYLFIPFQELALNTLLPKAAASGA